MLHIRNYILESYTKVNIPDSQLKDLMIKQAKKDYGYIKPLKPSFTDDNIRGLVFWFNDKNGSTHIINTDYLQNKNVI